MCIQCRLDMSSTHKAKNPQKKLDEILVAMPTFKETTSGLTSELQLVNSTGTFKIVSDTTDASYIHRA